jgi:DNA-directed RNA polymerase subunit M/transcription elongation factor TFIIS
MVIRKKTSNKQVLSKPFSTYPCYRLKGVHSFQQYLFPDMGVSLEVHVYNYCVKYMNLKDIPSEFIQQIYNTKLNDLIFNLNQQNSPRLLPNVIEGDIKIEHLPYIPSNELNRELWDPIIKKREYIDFKKNNMATTDAYTCRRCGESKCTSLQLQTRSADEPMTIFARCVNCGNSFTIN